MFFPTVDPIQQREEVIRFSEYMQRYLISSTPNKIGVTGNSLPEIGNYYSNIHQMAEKKKTNEHVRDERNKPGAFVIPRTYNIIDSHHCSIEKIIMDPNR